jgi:hypothetical protein
METTLPRIRQMEGHLDAAAEALRALDSALTQYAAVRPRLEQLIAYYESPQWLADYDADSAGLLPSDLKRGVLSEDAVYNLLADHDRLLALMGQFTKETEEH